MKNYQLESLRDLLHEQGLQSTEEVLSVKQNRLELHNKFPDAFMMEDSSGIPRFPIRDQYGQISFPVLKKTSIALESVFKKTNDSKYKTILKEVNNIINEVSRDYVSPYKQHPQLETVLNRYIIGLQEPIQENSDFNVDIEDCASVEAFFENVYKYVDENILTEANINLNPAYIRQSLDEYREMKKKIKSELGEANSSVYIAAIKDELQPIIAAAAKKSVDEIRHGNIEELKLTTAGLGKEMARVFIEVNTKIDWTRFPEGLFIAFTMMMTAWVLERFFFYLLGALLLGTGLISSTMTVGIIGLVLSSAVIHSLVTTTARSIAIKRGVMSELTMAYNVTFLAYIFAPGTKVYQIFLKVLSLWANSIASTIQVLAHRHDDEKAGFIFSVLVHSIIHILANAETISRYYGAPKSLPRKMKTFDLSKVLPDRIAI